MLASATVLVEVEEDAKGGSMDLFGSSPLALFGLAVLAIIASTPLVVVVVLRMDRKRLAMWARVANLHGLTLERGVMRGVKYGHEVVVREVTRGNAASSGASYTVVAATTPPEPGVTCVFTPEVRLALAMRYPLIRFDEGDTRVHLERRSFRVGDDWLSDAIECCARAAYDLAHARRQSAVFSPAPVESH